MRDGGLKATLASGIENPRATTGHNGIVGAWGEMIQFSEKCHSRNSEVNRLE